MNSFPPRAARFLNPNAPRARQSMPVDSLKQLDCGRAALTPSAPPPARSCVAPMRGQRFERCRDRSKKSGRTRGSQQSSIACLMNESWREHSAQWSRATWRASMAMAPSSSSAKRIAPSLVKSHSLRAPLALKFLPLVHFQGLIRCRVPAQ